MPAPTKYPDWGTDETNNVEPPDAKKAAGWVPAEEPPSGWFNWWKWIVGLWVRWLEERANTTDGHVAAAEADIDTLQSDLDALEAAHSTLAAAAALKASQNTFTKSQIINTESNWADDPIISTTAKPGDDPTDLSGVPAAAGSNRWKLVLKVPTQDDAWASLWVGQAPYGAVMANNARWHIPTQKWRQLDADYPSTAMVGRDGQYMVSYVPAGAAAWTDWPNDGGADFIASGNIQANGGGAAGNVIAANLFKYATPRTVWVQLFPEGGLNTFNDRMRLSAGESAIYRVRVPTGSVIGQINAKVEEYTNVNYTIQLMHTLVKSFGDFSTPGSTTTVKDSVHVNPGGTAVVDNHILNFPDMAVDNEFNFYWVRVVVDPASPADLDVYGVQIGYSDAGPRSH
jgi:hypothetical protein